ncbi:MAG: CopG family transcriptional regulator [Cyanobacteria bacterium J06638_20]
MANVTRVNLTGEYAIAVWAAAQQENVSQAEIVRKALRAYWGDDLSSAPKPQMTGSTVQPFNRSTVQPAGQANGVKPDLPSVSELFSHGA